MMKLDKSIKICDTNKGTKQNDIVPITTCNSNKDMTWELIVYTPPITCNLNKDVDSDIIIHTPTIKINDIEEGHFESDNIDLFEPYIDFNNIIQEKLYNYDSDMIKQLENEIQKLKNPDIYLVEMMTNLSDSDSDDNISIKMKILLRYHQDIAIKYNLKKYKTILNKYPSTFNIIIEYYDNIIHQSNIIINIQKWKQIYCNRIFWKKDIKQQIDSLNILYMKIISLYDGSRSNQLFHIKLRQVEYNKYHVDEMISRLTQIYKMFKYNFFEQIKCKPLLFIDFIELPFNEMINYMEYIYINITTILNYYINQFQQYEFYRNKLEHLLNPYQNINNCISSDMGSDDILYILKNNN